MTFNSTNWNQTREIVIVGVDDDIIRYSPYGGILNLTTTSKDNSINAAGELTILVTDTDECEFTKFIITIITVQDNNAWFFFLSVVWQLQ